MEDKVKLVEDIMELLREQKEVLQELVQESTGWATRYGEIAHEINKKIGHKISEL